LAIRQKPLQEGGGGRKERFYASFKLLPKKSGFTEKIREPAKTQRLAGFWMEKAKK
jgi:hypothetical protein